MAFQPCKRSSSRCWTVRGEVTRNYTVAMKGGRGHWQILGPPGAVWRMVRIGRVHHQHNGGGRQCGGKHNFKECGGKQQSKPLALAPDKFKVVMPKTMWDSDQLIGALCGQAVNGPSTVDPAGSACDKVRRCMTRAGAQQGRRHTRRQARPKACGRGCIDKNLSKIFL
jgi:hypothetical protein